MRAIILVLTLLFLNGCLSTSFKYGDRTEGRKEEISRTFLISGLVNANEPLRAYDFCPEGVAKVTTIHTFGDLVLSCLTVSIYSPNTVRVSCQGGSTHTLYLNDDDYVVAHESYDNDGTPLAATRYETH